MPALVQIDVTLWAKSSSTGPDENSVEFVYTPTKLNPYPGVTICSNGDIDVEKISQDIEFQFILRTRSLNWGTDDYAVTFAPKDNDIDDDVLWVSPNSSKPSKKWDAQKKLFANFRVSEDPTDIGKPKNTCMSLTMNKKSVQNPRRNYAYALAVTFHKAGTLPKQVRDDPQIKNGGYGFHSMYTWIAVGIGLLAIGAISGFLASRLIA